MMDFNFNRIMLSINPKNCILKQRNRTVLQHITVSNNHINVPYMNTSTKVGKPCISCNQNKPLTSYYKHSGMSDGHLNKCKVCVKEYSKIKHHLLKTNPDWLKAKRARGRLYAKNHPQKRNHQKRKKYNKKYKQSYPEKIKARNRTQRLIKKNSENQLHHWSYNKEHYKDVIELSVLNHNFAHRFLDYDQSKKMYRSQDGVLLDTKMKHLRYIASIKSNLEKDAA